MSERSRLVNIVILILLLVVLVTLGAVLFFRVHFTEKEDNISSDLAEKSYSIRRIGWRPGDVIKKSIINGDTARYELIGEFVTPMERSVDSLLVGQFRLHGDSRQTQVQVGAANGTIYMGEYHDSFQGDAVWRWVDTDEMKQVLGNQEILLRLDVKLDPNDLSQ